MPNGKSILGKAPPPQPNGHPLLACPCSLPQQAPTREGVLDNQHRFVLGHSSLSNHSSHQSYWASAGLKHGEGVTSPGSVAQIDIFLKIFLPAQTQIIPFPGAPRPTGRLVSPVPPCWAAFYRPGLNRAASGGNGTTLPDQITHRTPLFLGATRLGDVTQNPRSTGSHVPPSHQS